MAGLSEDNFISQWENVKENYQSIFYYTENRIWCPLQRIKTKIFKLNRLTLQTLALIKESQARRVTHAGP